MPLTQVRTFRVRQYECDAHGNVQPANYLRYMQETAFDASAAAGYNMDRYAAIGRHWLVRETEIEVLRPLHYNDLFQIRTWVADFRRIRSRRAYEFSLAGSAEPVARAMTDWVFLDSAGGRPAAIPPEMMAAFHPEGPPESVPPRSRFPGLPARPDGAFHLWRRVEWQDLDQMQHVNNAVYVAYIEDCGVQAAAAHGWPPDRMAAEGFVLQTCRQQIEYRQPASLNDELELTTWASTTGESGGMRYSAIRRAGEATPAARALTSWACVDLATGQPVSIPENFLADLAPNMAPFREA
jgi:acyl-CoA thioester hydrolase